MTSCQTRHLAISSQKSPLLEGHTTALPRCACASPASRLSDVFF